MFPWYFNYPVSIQPFGYLAIQGYITPLGGSHTLSIYENAETVVYNLGSSLFG